MTKFLQLSAILVLAAALMPLNANAQEQKKEQPAKAAPAPRAAPAARPAPAARAAPQRQAPQRAAAPQRLRKGPPRRNVQAPQRAARTRRRRAPQRAAAPAHRPHPASSTGRPMRPPGQRRRQCETQHHPQRPPLHPPRKRARNYAASKPRSARYSNRRTGNCGRYRLHSARRSSRKSINSASCARSSDKILTRRIRTLVCSRTPPSNPMRKRSALRAATVPHA